MLIDVKPAPWLLFAALGAACSSTPRASGPVVASAAALQPTTAAGGAPTTTTPSPSVPPGEVDPAIVKAGYSVMKRKDTIYYCRNETITGQRIATRVCLTAAQIQTEKTNVTKARDLLSEGGNRCVKPACPD